MGPIFSDGVGNSHKMLNISAHRLDGSSGSQRLKSIPQQMQEEAVGGLRLEVGRGGAGDTLRLRI